MPDFEFRFDWEDPLGVRGTELRSTWARLSIWVRGEAITSLFDTKLNSVRDYVYLPLYPLTEWITTHWWNLLEEPFTPGRSAQSNYQYRHSLRFAREGYALPDLTIRSIGSSINLQWRSTELENQKLIFLKSGSTYIEKRDVEDAFTQLITSVVERLNNSGLSENLLIKEWEALSALEDEEVEFCKSAAALGLDPLDLTNEEQAKIIAASDVVPASARTEFFEAADIESLDQQLERFGVAIDMAETSTANLESLKRVQERVPQVDPNQSPWTQGYDIARALRRMLDLDETVVKDLGEISRALGLRRTDLRSSVAPIDSSYGLFDALVATNRTGSPCFVVDKKDKAAQKFAVCRGLFEYFYSQNGGPLLVTKAKSERQKRNRAFAAEFLVPASLLKNRLHSSFIADEEIDELAGEFGVSPFVIRYQITNHRLAELIVTE